MRNDPRDVHKRTIYTAIRSVRRAPAKEKRLQHKFNKVFLNSFLPSSESLC